jgi:hypothetical protein
MACFGEKIKKMKKCEILKDIFNYQTNPHVE